MAERLTNWAGNFTYSAARVHRPSTVEEVQYLVSRAPKVRALGTRHSFNDIADCAEDLVSTERLSRVVALDRERSQVTVEGGLAYGNLCGYLQESGFALHNLASLPHISIAGACATATHGSGDRNGNLATAVAALEVVKADGELLRLRRGEADFDGAVVSLGALGVVTQLTLDVQPTFDVRQEVYEGLPLETVVAHFDEITSSAYSVSLFTDWSDSSIDQVWVKRRADDGSSTDRPSDFFGAQAASGPRHPIFHMSPVNCTEQMGVDGPWHARLPHFRMEFTPSSGEELQAEYLVPRRHAPSAIQAVAEMRERISPLLQISEIRTIAADDLWMSPCYGGGCVGIHFTLKPDWPAVRELLPEIDTALAPFEPRPHWGKLFTMSPDRVASGFERLADFRHLANRIDPAGKFRNAYMAKLLD